MAYIILLLLTRTWFEVRTGGAFNYISMDEYNRCAEDVNAYCDKQDQEPGIIIDGRMNSWHIGFEVFNPEIILGIKLTALSIGAGLGTTPILSSTSSKITTQILGVPIISEADAHLRSIPVILSANAMFGLSNFKLLGKVGLGWYPTWLYEDVESQNGEYTKYNAALSSMSGFGLDGKVGFGFSLMPIITIQTGISGRWARIGGFEGEYEETTDGDKTTGDCVLAYGWNEDIEGYQWSAMDKDDFNDSNYEEGTVNLTGFGLFLMLSFSF